MQGKGIIRFFLVIITIVCFIQYMYLLPTRGVESDAEEFAVTKAVGQEGDSEYLTSYKEARRSYLDSMSDEVIFSIPMINDFTYNDLKSQQLALGLDLKGGLSVVLQVDLKKFLVALSENSKDEDFNLALDLASDRLKVAQTDYITLFGQAFSEIASDKKLATIFARSPSLREDMNYETSNGEVLRILRERANETVDLTYKRLKDRIDKFGVTQPNVSLDEGRDLILVELPGVDNPERAKNYLQATARLEFWDVYRISDQGVQAAFTAADEKLAALNGDTATVDDAQDSLGTLAQVEQTGPLFSKFRLNGVDAAGNITMPFAVMGTATENNKEAVIAMLERPEIRSLFPKNMGFRWSSDPRKDYETGEVTKEYQLYAIKMPKGAAKPPLEGDHIIKARSNPDPTTGEVKVSIEMDREGTSKWARMTTKAAQDNNREIAIILDDAVVSAPTVNQPITGGNSEISGDFTIQEGQDLANILEIGKLPAETIIIQQETVGPSLGAENIQKSMLSLLIGFTLVLLFMIAYYGSSGIVSIIALFANLFFIFGALSSVGTVLTLPGIAGIVLTIGMAVDANVIIFERIREELREGKGLRLAVSNGFQYSYSAIIDANVTTILTAIVLAYFGLGPIKGFAVVLIIGVICTLITAVLFARLVIDWWLSKGKDLTFWTGFSKNLFANLQIDWLGKRKMAYIISGIIILAGIASFATRGFELGVDFKGGYSYNIEFAEDQTVEAESLRAELADVFGEEPVVKAVDTRNTFRVTTAYGIDNQEKDAEDEVMSLLHQGINNLTGGNIKLEDFRTADASGTHVTSYSQVTPVIADDIVNSSYYATIFALLLIFLYIFIRFSKWQYSLGAVAALFHDTLIVLAVFSLGYGWLPFSLEIDQAFIAALLTVIGYSINDTVIVFDRIREFTNTYTSRGKKEVINMAINSTVSRTVITSLTTMLVVLILFIFGGTSIKGFAFALVVGILVGTYSSIFVATPIMADLSPDFGAKNQKAKSRTKANA